MKGIEPPRLAAPDPKSSASTNFATSACVLLENGVQIYDFFNAFLKICLFVKAVFFIQRHQKLPGLKLNSDWMHQKTNFAVCLFIN